MSKKKPNKQWVHNQNKDQYVRKSRQSHYRSRAVYKLWEIDKKDKLIRTNACIVDLGSAPGSWSQYASEHVGTNGRVIAVDILAMDPISGVQFIQGDFTEEAIENQCLELVGKQGADLVISDMAPNMSGIRAVDQPAAMYLVELALDLAARVLKPGGNFVAKIFQGEGFDELLKEARERFDRVAIRKPDASRSRSREIYLVAKGLK